MSEEVNDSPKSVILAYRIDSLSSAQGLDQVAKQSPDVNNRLVAEDSLVQIKLFRLGHLRDLLRVGSKFRGKSTFVVVCIVLCEYENVVQVEPVV